MSELEPPQRSAPSKDEVFAILKNQRRRRVIRYLQQHDGTCQLRELTAEIAAMENEVAVEELTYDQRKVIYVSLYQTHIPRLEEADIITYDHRSGTITLTEHATECDALLSVADNTEHQSEEHGGQSRLMLPLLGVAHLNFAVVGSWILGQEGLTLSALGGTTLAIAAMLTIGTWVYWYTTN